MRAAALAIVLAPAVAYADGTMPGMDMGDGGGGAPAEQHVSVGVSLLAANFSTESYVGNYQGALPQVMWSRGRFGAMASIGAYRLTENGREVKGVGDAMAMGSATIVDGERVSVGTQLGVMAPTGSMTDGLGMGHAMGSLVVTSAVKIDPRFSVHASAGFSRAMMTGGMMHHHGAMPLVEPMNMSEVVWSAGGDALLAHGIAPGVRVWGGAPVGEAGVTRVESALRIAWGAGRLSTAAELQFGLAGDPFVARGILETGVTF